MPYLDVIHEAAQRFDYPICAYHVSGEYSMLRMAVDQGIMGEEVILLLLAIKRAVAKLIITYFALDIARKLKVMRDEAGTKRCAVCSGITAHARRRQFPGALFRACGRGAGICRAGVWQPCRG
ncbi:MAG: hypothetical protein V8T10_00035 [Merdibacter sp.]